jgi:hypothetical protein
MLDEQTEAANGGFSGERPRKETMCSPVYNTRYPATPSPRGRLIWRVTVLSPRKRHPWKVNETLDEKARGASESVSLDGLRCAPVTT